MDAVRGGQGRNGFPVGGEMEYKKAASKVPYMHRGEEMTPERLMKLIGWHRQLVSSTLKPLADLYEVDPEIFRKERP